MPSVSVKSGVKSITQPAAKPAAKPDAVVVPRLRKFRVSLDERTGAMPDEVLECRGFNHHWVRRPVSPARFIAMARQGYKEVVRVCQTKPDGTGGCGNTWTQVFNRNTGGLVEDDRSYDANYKVPRGSGRMSKAEARKALWAREDAELYK